MSARQPILGFLVFALACIGPLAASPVPIVPERLPAQANSAWKGAQIVSADRAGNVFFFRGDTFDVFPVTKTGALGEPERLQLSAPRSGMVHDAVLSPAGDRWLIHGDVSVRLFVDGKEKALPPIPWKPWSVAFLRDTPVAAVLPLPMGRSADIEELGTPPRFLRFDAGRWTPAHAQKDISADEALHKPGKLNEIVEEQSVYLAGDRQGRLWAAGQYRYKVERFSPGFRPGLEIMVDDGRVRKEASPGPVEIRRTAGQNPREATVDPSKERATYYPFSSEAVILDLTEGRDGRVYFLVETEDRGAALDRFDPALSAVERVPLQMKAQGRFTLASGKDGLYIAAWNPEGGRWRISWEALDQAGWKTLGGCEIDGVPVSDSAVPGRFEGGR